MILQRKTFFIVALFVLIIGAGLVFYHSGFGRSPSYSESEMEEQETEDVANLSLGDRRLRLLANWTRPQGPFRVALQAGHWKAQEAPDEQQGLRVRTGTTGGGTTEWQVNLNIAEETKKLLEPHGIIVDILPVTIPPEYFADVFISIHADGNLDTSINGYKVAAPRRDVTGKAQNLAQLLEAEYGKATNLDIDPNVTRAMRGYYAFNWRRYEHAIHPMTVAAIVETGFLSNAGDSRIIVNDPQKSAAGIVAAILAYKQTQGF